MKINFRVDVCNPRQDKNLSFYYYYIQGLTFSVHADAAWGGYLNCMTHGDPDKYITTADTKAHDYVPTIPLSEFVDKQYRKLADADTGNMIFIFRIIISYCLVSTLRFSYTFDFLKSWIFNLIRSSTFSISSKYF